MFMDVFNDITIRRQSGKKIKVKLLNGKRSRIFKALENPGRTPIEPPIIAVSRTGVTRDADRVADLNSHLLRTTGSSIDYDFYAPNPVDLSFELSILTKKQSDMDRIISNFIPFCNKSFFVKTPHPKIKSQVIKHEVIWDGEINEEDKSEIADTENELFLSTTTFTFKTWIWAGTQKELEEQAIIKKINVFPNLFSLGTLELLSQATNETQLLTLVLYLQTDF